MTALILVCRPSQDEAGPQRPVRDCKCDDYIFVAMARSKFVDPVKEGL
jgi:hypothetical protein